MVVPVFSINAACDNGQTKWRVNEGYLCKATYVHVFTCASIRPDLRSIDFIIYEVKLAIICRITFGILHVLTVLYVSQYIYIYFNGLPFAISAASDIFKSILLNLIQYHITLSYDTISLCGNRLFCIVILE